MVIHHSIWATNKGGSKMITVVHLVMITQMEAQAKIEENQDIRSTKVWGVRRNNSSHTCLQSLVTILSSLNNLIACKVSLMVCHLWWIQWVLKWVITHLNFCLRCKPWLTCSSNSTWLTCTSRCNKCKLLNSNNNNMLWTCHNLMILLSRHRHRHLLFQQALTVTTFIHSTNQTSSSIAMIQTNFHSS